MFEPKYENDRFRTWCTAPVRKLVFFISYMLYNKYTFFVHKITLCHEFLPTAGYRPSNRTLKTSVVRLKRPGLLSDLSD
ncbi:hypothetical protein CIW66_18470 [Enterobacter cloacae]|nr:hypothetical protein CIW66_18470 [Enterobacter cloacae]